MNYDDASYYAGEGGCETRLAVSMDDGVYKGMYARIWSIIFINHSMQIYCISFIIVNQYVEKYYSCWSTSFRSKYIIIYQRVYCN